MEFLELTKDMLSEGKSENEITRFLREKYGDQAPSIGTVRKWSRQMYWSGIESINLTTFLNHPSRRPEKIQMRRNERKLSGESMLSSSSSVSMGVSSIRKENEKICDLLHEKNDHVNNDNNEDIYEVILLSSSSEDEQEFINTVRSQSHSSSKQNEVF